MNETRTVGLFATGITLFLCGIVRLFADTPVLAIWIFAIPVLLAWYTYHQVHVERREDEEIEDRG